VLQAEKPCSDSVTMFSDTMKVQWAAVVGLAAQPTLSHLYAKINVTVVIINPVKTANELMR
jgi:hypothetical protein